MKYKYIVSGDGTNETYGIYRLIDGQSIFAAQCIATGILSIALASRKIKELLDSDKVEHVSSTILSSR